MGVSVQWDNPEQTRILVSYHRTWTLEQLYQAVEECTYMIDAVPHTVDIIHDWQQTTVLPAGAMNHMRYLIEKRHPRSGITVFVGANKTFTALWQVFSEFYSVLLEDHFLLTHSVDQARDIL